MWVCLRAAILTLSHQSGPNNYWQDLYSASLRYQLMIRTNSNLNLKEMFNPQAVLKDISWPQLELCLDEASVQSNRVHLKSWNITRKPGFPRFLVMPSAHSGHSSSWAPQRFLVA